MNGRCRLQHELTNGKVTSLFGNFSTKYPNGADAAPGWNAAMVGKNDFQCGSRNAFAVKSGEPLNNFAVNLTFEAGKLRTGLELLPQ